MDIDFLLYFSSKVPMPSIHQCNVNCAPILENAESLFVGVLLMQLGCRFATKLLRVDSTIRALGHISVVNHL